MALIACPECGQTISSEAEKCPHCRTPLDPRRTKVDYVTGEVIGVRPRPGARAAPRPVRYSSWAGVVMMTGGSALIIFGSFLPWVRRGPISISGLEGNGRITVVVGLVTLVVGLTLRSSPSQFPRILVIVGAALAILVAAIDNNRLREELQENLIGAGIGTVFAGGIVALIGTFLRDR